MTKFLLLCAQYRHVLERIGWLESGRLSIWGCLELQALYCEEIALRAQIEAALQ